MIQITRGLRSSKRDELLMALAIVMPAYNESSCIEFVVRSWLTVLDRVPGFMVVVNDGSKDQTVDDGSMKFRIRIIR